MDVLRAGGGGVSGVVGNGDVLIMLIDVKRPSPLWTILFLDMGPRLC